MVKTHFSQYPGPLHGITPEASFITFFYTNGASRLLVWFKEKKILRHGVIEQNHMLRSIDQVKSLAPEERDIKKSMLLRKKQTNKKNKARVVKTIQFGEHAKHCSVTQGRHIFIPKMTKMRVQLQQTGGPQLPVLEASNSFLAGLFASILFNHAQICSLPLTQGPF